VRIILDHCTPAPLAKAFVGHGVVVAEDLGWERMNNGKLLSAAELAGFQVLISADQSIPHQQNFTGRRIALLVLTSPHWPSVRPHAERIAAVALTMQPGEYREYKIT
jgi:hypothetical protein